jgi:DNA-binding HxlR family transcriptional regulator
MKHLKRNPGGIEYTMKAIGPKWTVFIIHELMGGTRRFGEIEKKLKGISPRTLSLRLSAMERMGVVERKVYAEVPPRVEYRLTTAGRELEHVLRAMELWGSAHAVKRRGKNLAK